MVLRDVQQSNSVSFHLKGAQNYALVILIVIIIKDTYKAYIPSINKI